jgi:hypothetical protein
MTMSDSDDSQEFDPQEMVEQRESSDPLEALLEILMGYSVAYFFPI